MNLIPRELHSAFGKILTNGSYFGVKVVPVVAVASSVFFAFSPWHTIERIRKAKSTMEFSFTPYFFFTLQSVLFLLYAYATSNRLLTFTTTIGCTLGSYYVKVFYQFSHDKQTAQAYIGAGILISLALSWEALTRSARESQFLIGIAGNIVMIMTAASPLGKLKDVLKKKDASIFPYGMAVMNVLAGGIWTLYGILLEDIVVIFPNAVSLVLGIFQIYLIFRYPGKKSKITLDKSDRSIEDRIHSV